VAGIFVTLDFCHLISPRIAEAQPAADDPTSVQIEDWPTECC